MDTLNNQIKNRSVFSEVVTNTLWYTFLTHSVEARQRSNDRNLSSLAPTYRLRPQRNSYFRKHCGAASFYTVRLYATQQTYTVWLNGLVVSALGIRARGPRFDSLVAVA